MSKRIISILIIFFFNLKNLLSANLTVESYDYHKVLTQVYRWYQLYENNNIPVANSLDLFNENVVIENKLSNGKITNTDQYLSRIEDLPKTWQNAHHLNSININQIKRLNKNTLEVNFEITYQNIGMKANELTAYKLNYKIILKDQELSLPKITSLEISPSTNAVDDNYKNTFNDAYPKNRVLSLVHYWLSVIERSNFDNISPTLLKEITTKDIILNFPSGKLVGYSDLENWYKGPASDVINSVHKIENFKIVSINNNVYNIEMVFNWSANAKDKNKTLRQLRTLHKWVVIDNPKDRFAKIKEVNVEVLK